jgi:hypothetical protein
MGPMQLENVELEKWYPEELHWEIEDVEFV